MALPRNLQCNRCKSILVPGNKKYAHLPACNVSETGPNEQPCSNCEGRQCQMPPEIAQYLQQRGRPVGPFTNPHKTAYKAPQAPAPAGFSEKRNTINRKMQDMRKKHEARIAGIQQQHQREKAEQQRRYQTLQGQGHRGQGNQLEDGHTEVLGRMGPSNEGRSLQREFEPLRPETQVENPHMDVQLQNVGPQQVGYPNPGSEPLNQFQLPAPAPAGEVPGDYYQQQLAEAIRQYHNAPLETASRATSEGPPREDQ